MSVDDDWIEEHDISEDNDKIIKSRKFNYTMIMNGIMSGKHCKSTVDRVILICFLEIGNIESHKNQNIFHTNPDLYDKLKKTTLLPFTKIHSLTQK